MKQAGKIIAITLSLILAFALGFWGVSAWVAQNTGGA